MRDIKRKQRTLSAPISYSGIGIHTGQEVSITFHPAKEGTGILFRRVDLPGTPTIPATFEYVFDTSRSTNIGIEDAKIYTIEHVLSALKAFDIDNLFIDISSIEPPAGNGSSDVFVNMIEKAGVGVQQGEVPIVGLQEPVVYSDGDIHLVAIPDTEYKISYTLHYPQSEALGTQFFSLSVNEKTFKKQVMHARTFALYEELSFLMDRGLIKGGSLENAVVIKDEVVISKGGLFYPNEMVRHKVLDLIGDLSLVGMPFNAHIIALRSGHAANVAFAQKIFHQLSNQKGRK